MFGEIDPRDAAAAALVGALRRCEELSGALYAEQGRLAAAAIAAEGAFGLSAVAGQMVLAAVTDAQRRTTDARGGLVLAHRQLERLGKRMGLDVSLYGDTGKPPEKSDDFFTTGFGKNRVAD